MPKLPRFLDKDNPLEKKIEKPVCDYGRSLGIVIRKYANPSRRNAPDDICFVRAAPWPRVFLVEFKSKGKKPTPGQLSEHDIYRAMGIPVFVVDNIAEGKALMGIMA